MHSLNRDNVIKRGLIIPYDLLPLSLIPYTSCASLHYSATECGVPSWVST